MDYLIVIIVILGLLYLVFSAVNTFLKHLEKAREEQGKTISTFLLQLFEKDIFTLSGIINTIMMFILAAVFIALNVPTFLEKIGLSKSDNVDPIWSFLILAFVFLASLYIVNKGED